jgi:hypothetical protein
MRRFLGLAILIALAASPAKAQITPKYEISGGYQFTRFNDPTSSSQIYLNGGDFSAVKNYYRFVGVAVDVSASYNRQSSTINPAINGETSFVLTYLAGPRFYPFGHHKLTFFGEALVGGGFFHAGIPAVPPFPHLGLNTTALGWAGDIGVDYRLRDHWALRLDGGYFPTRFFSSTYGGQSNERIVLGVVYSFGVRGPHRHK